MIPADRKHAYAYDDLIASGKGTLFGPGMAQLPLPPMLMFDRITQIDADGGWGGSKGKGRALGGGIKLSGQVTNDIALVEYGIDLRRAMRSRVALGIADGWVKADGKVIYEATDLRVGLFTDI